MVAIESSGPQTYRGGVYVLDKDVVISYRDRRVQADHVEYDSNTGEATMTGRVLVLKTGTQERISASHGTYNLRTETGRFYDVSGSYGIQMTPAQHRMVYTTDSPFLFTGRVVVKTGPDAYDVYEGTVTSCQLPHPDWLLSAAHIALDKEKASAHNATFRLLNFPFLFLPYATHPADAEARQSGFLIPQVDISNQKGVVIGEQVYLALSRSLDMRIGAAYYSSIGWEENATVRYKGQGLDFGTLHYSGVMDRRKGALQQGGEEAVFAGRHDISENTRVAANIDYLSSYIYREAFSDTFNQAVTSDIVSTAYLTHDWNGIEFAGLADRYQGIKLVAQGSTPQQQVRIFHVPTGSFMTTEHRVAGTGTGISTGLEISMESSASGLKRTQPNFETGGIIERFDLHPQASYPMDLEGWHLVPSIAARETIYSRSRDTPVAGQGPKQSAAALTRSDFEFALTVRPPVLTRTFQPTHAKRLLGAELRHTIEPELTYRLTDGVSGFTNILRFDAVDVVSNTNEAEYGVTQRIFRRVAASRTGQASTCGRAAVASSPGFNSDAPNTEDDMPEAADEPVATVEGRCPSDELISWRITQKYFFDQNFGGTVINGRRNIFQTTLDLSGVAFLTEPREVSPVISRLRLRTSAHTDVEWDFDLDTGARKFNSSNVFVDLHQGNSFAALSYARLDAPGRFYTENPTPTTGVASSNGVTSAISDFNQLRVLAGYGNPVKRGLSVAMNIGIDLKALYGATNSSTVTTGGTTSNTTTTVYPALLQYATVQASYNWNCCGLAIEYRKLQLGSVRNDGTYRFNFTLANIGAAGNLRRAERLF
jgi:LPS-assembly protein